jgi:DNA-binding GntR family transcriptional regulator
MAQRAEITATPLRRVSTVEALVQSLRQQILSGDLSPRTRFREVELSRAFGVGRHSLRAAFQALVHEGLLAHEPHRGVFLPELSAEDALDIFQLRIALETEAARVLVEKRCDIDEAAAAVERMESFTGNEPWADVRATDLGFHGALIGAVDSPRMSKTFASLLAELRLLLAQAKPGYDDLETLAAQHRIVLEALLSRRSQRAVDAVREHLEDGLRDILRLISA